MEKLLKKTNKSNSRICNKENSVLGIKRPMFKNKAPVNRSLNTWSLGLKNSSIVQKQNISSTNNRETLVPMETDVPPSPPSRQSSSPKVVSSTSKNVVLTKETSRIIPSNRSNNIGANSSRFVKPSSSFIRRPRSNPAVNVSRSLFKDKPSILNKNQMQRRETSFLRPTSASQLDISRSSRATQRMPIYLNGMMPPMNAFNCTSSASSVIMPGLNSTNSMFKFPGFGMSQFSFEKSSNVQRVQELLSVRQEKKLKDILKIFISSKDVDDLHKMFFVEKLIMRIKQANELCEAQRQYLCQEPVMSCPSENAMVPQFPVSSSLTPEQKMEQVASWMKSTEQEDECASEILESLRDDEEFNIDALDQQEGEVEEEEENEDFAHELEEEQESQENLNEKPSKKLCGTYALRDWTLVLGNGPTDLKVSGTVIHILMRTVVEENHISDVITEVTNNSTVKTNSCTYVLNGRIIDPNNLVPETIKTSFKKIGFPKNWQEICRRWHAINDGGAPSNGRRNPREPINNSSPKRRRGNKDLSTPKSRNIALNSTIITRSVSKKLDQKRLGAFKYIRK